VVKCSLVIEFLRSAPAQPKQLLKSQLGPGPPGMAVSIQQALHPGHLPRTFQQLYRFSLFHYDFAPITSVCTGQTIPEQGAQPLFSSPLSSVVPKGPGLWVGEQEIGNTHQMYK